MTTGQHSNQPRQIWALLSTRYNEIIGVIFETRLAVTFCDRIVHASPFHKFMAFPFLDSVPKRGSCLRGESLYQPLSSLFFQLSMR